MPWLSENEKVSIKNDDIVSSENESSTNTSSTINDENQSINKFSVEIASIFLSTASAAIVEIYVIKKRR